MLPELLKVLLETCAAVDAAALLLLEGDVLRVRAAAGIGLEDSIGETVRWDSLSPAEWRRRGPLFPLPTPPRTRS